MEKFDSAYQAALDYIYSFIDFSLKRNLRNAEANFKLDRMARFMSLLGNPQDQYKIIHVAGTKGKGSVCAFCASALRVAGYRVGLYTSPHLEEFTERIQVNGIEIDKISVVKLVEKMKAVVTEVPDITTFELTTAMGFLYFAEQKVDVAVLEVGLGGRLDATNIVNPLVSVITSISYDHTAVLGNTLGKIAFEKGGIIKPGKPVVIAPQREEARKRLVAVCRERSAPLVEVGKDFQFKAESHSLQGQTLFVWKNSGQLTEDRDPALIPGTVTNLRIPLLGYHQVINAVTAYAALQIANDHGLTVSDDAIQRGFETTSWPGRFELLCLHPPVVVDSAHNTDSAKCLSQALDDYFPGLPVILVFGVSADKDVKGILKALLPKVRKVITSQSIHPRAMDAKELLAYVKQNDVHAEAIVPIEDAIQTALNEAGEEALVLITGSVFVAAAGRAVWRQMQVPHEKCQ
jgi:dihydrofolate synthase/folylpolyglutamate synthase